MVMEKGRVVEIGTVRAIFDTPQQPYTRRLLAAGLDPDPEVQKVRRLALT
jgi:peptide/nickel transport system ATP-binding protein